MTPSALRPDPGLQPADPLRAIIQSQNYSGHSSFARQRLRFYSISPITPSTSFRGRDSALSLPVRQLWPTSDGWRERARLVGLHIEFSAPGLRRSNTRHSLIVRCCLNRSTISSYGTPASLRCRCAAAHRASFRHLASLCGRGSCTSLNVNGGLRERVRRNNFHRNGISGPPDPD